MTEFYATPAKDFKILYNLINFVETGCYRGDGLQHAIDIGFMESELNSCDIRQEAVDSCLKRFPTSNLFTGDSLDFMHQLLPTLHGPTLFWLDAHYPEHYGVKSASDLQKMPMFEEINIIKKLKSNFKDDVIICDDLHVIMDANNPHCNKQLEDYFKINTSWVDFTTMLSDTHDFISLKTSESIGIFYPKSK